MQLICIKYAQNMQHLYNTIEYMLHRCMFCMFFAYMHPPLC
jgi:hypothetical protein